MEKKKETRGRPAYVSPEKKCIVRSYTVPKDVFIAMKAKINQDDNNTISGLIQDAFYRYLSETLNKK